MGGEEEKLTKPQFSTLETTGKLEITLDKDTLDASLLKGALEKKNNKKFTPIDNDRSWNVVE